MTTEQIIEQLNGLFAKQLNLPGLKLSPTTTAADIEEWDSLSHIQLIVAIEKHFKIKFGSMEIRNFKDVGNMVESIQKKLQP